MNTSPLVEARESVGEFLRQGREAKGLTLDEVARTTRIQLEYLKALEEGNFGKLPALVFAKGFVRAYARSLGLDEEDAIRRFQASAGTFYTIHQEQERLRQQQALDQCKRKTSRQALVGVVVVATLSVSLLLARERGMVSVIRSAEPTTVANEAYLTGTTDRAPGDSVGHPQSTAPATGETTKPASFPTQPAHSDPLAGLPVERGMPAEPTEQDLVLALEALELSWVVVQTDEASPHEALLRPGDRLTWKAKEKFVLTIGNAGGVRAELNGKPLPPFGGKGKVVRDIKLTRENNGGMREDPSGP
jgi:cytoskeletal protein RodZ